MEIETLVEKIKFIDLPIEKESQEYERSSEIFVEYFHNHPSIANVCNIGEINDPGISDIDFLLVLKEDACLDKNDFRFIKNLDDYIFIHPPFLINESLLPYINYLFYINKMWCYKETEEYFFPEKSSAKSQLLLLICTEATLGRLCDISYLLSQGIISTRKMLLKLHSIKHVIVMLGGINDNEIEENWMKYIEDIIQLRKSWFYSERVVQLNRLKEMIIRGINVLKEIIDYLPEELNKIFNGINDINLYSPSYFLLPNALQVLKITNNDKCSVKYLKNPLVYFNKNIGNMTNKIARHLNNISIITIPEEIILVLLHAIGILDEGFKKPDEIFIANGPPVVKNNDSLEILYKRSSIIKKYFDFIILNDLDKLSTLSHAPWTLERKAKFYQVKKMFLKILVKMKFA